MCEFLERLKSIGSSQIFLKLNSQNIQNVATARRIDIGMDAARCGPMRPSESVFCEGSEQGRIRAACQKSFEVFNP